MMIKANCILFAVCFFLIAPKAHTQLDETCTVMLNGQTVNVGLGGEFALDVPAGPYLWRIYAFCEKDGKVRYGRTLFFEFPPGKRLHMSELDFVWQEEPFAQIESITAAADNPALTDSLGQTMQVRVTAHLSDGETTDVTTRRRGTTYISSNANVATVDKNGSVTATGRGAVFITVNNEGASAVALVTVAPGDPLTTVMGFVQLEDGTFVEDALVRIVGQASTDTTGPNGSFSIPNVLTSQGIIKVRATKTVRDTRLYGITTPLQIVPGGMTDAGLIILRALGNPQFADNLFPQTGLGPDQIVRAMTVFDDGDGAALYVAGDFNDVDGSNGKRVARWNGTKWQSIGFDPTASVPPGFVRWIYSLTGFDDGIENALYAGWTSGGLPTVAFIDKWNGMEWSLFARLGGRSIVLDFAVFDDGNGRALYAGGSFVDPRRIAKWDGTAWQQVGGGMNNSVLALAAREDESERALYAGGIFTQAGDTLANRIARWDGIEWAPLSSGMDNNVHDLVVFDDGTGPALYAGGVFIIAGGVTANRVAKWNGTDWLQLVGGMNGAVNALAVYDDGTGPALYAGGDFTIAGGVPANRLAKWDGTAWSALGSGVNSSVTSLMAFDDGTGPALFIGGNFTATGGIASRRVAKWFRPVVVSP
jgi:hypothetical protein